MNTTLIFTRRRKRSKEGMGTVDKEGRRGKGKVTHRACALSTDVRTPRLSVMMTCSVEFTSTRTFTIFNLSQPALGLVQLLGKHNIINSTHAITCRINRHSYTCTLGTKSKFRGNSLSLHCKDRHLDPLPPSIFTM